MWFKQPLIIEIDTTNKPPMKAGQVTVAQLKRPQKLLVGLFIRCLNGTREG